MKNFILQLISQIKSGRHHGRGSKYTRNGNFELALSHFKTALKFALLSGNDALVPLEMECVARTLVRIGDYEQAQKYANDSYCLYKKFQGEGPVFDESIKRVEELLTLIERRDIIH